MGKLLKARPKGFGIMERAMNVKDPRVKASLLNEAAQKVAEYREANAGLARDNEELVRRLRSSNLALEAALKQIAKLEGKPYPPGEIITADQAGK